MDGKSFTTRGNLIADEIQPSGCVLDIECAFKLPPMTIADQSFVRGFGIVKDDTSDLRRVARLIEKLTNILIK
jgi:hypothetical protein